MIVIGSFYTGLGVMKIPLLADDPKPLKPQPLKRCSFQFEGGKVFLPENRLQDGACIERPCSLGFGLFWADWGPGFRAQVC